VKLCEPIEQVLHSGSCRSAPADRSLCDLVHHDRPLAQLQRCAMLCVYHQSRELIPGHRTSKANDLIGGEDRALQCARRGEGSEVAKSGIRSVTACAVAERLPPGL